MHPVPVTTPIARILLWSILILALVDLSLSLVHVGLTSFFLGTAAAGATVVHTITQLVIILLRERGSWKAPTEELPVASKLSSIVMGALLTVLFLAAFVITMLVQVQGYFGSNWTGRVVYADAAMEMVCAIALTVLVAVGSLERRKFLEVTRRNRLEGAMARR